MLGNRPIFTIEAELEAIITLGSTPYGERRFVGIEGGSVKGSKLNGRVLPSALLHDEIKEGRLQSWPITKPTIVTKLFVATSMQRPQTMATKRR
jgi:Protein of unknown function (DUF3237)